MSAEDNKAIIRRFYAEIDNGKLYLHYALGNGVVSTTVIVRWPGFAYLSPTGQTRVSATPLSSS